MKLKNYPILLLITLYAAFWSSFFLIEGGLIHQGALAITRIQHYRINGIYPMLAGIAGLILVSGFLRFKMWGRKGILIFFGLNVLCTLSYLLMTYSIDVQKFMIEFLDLIGSLVMMGYLLNRQVKKLFI